MSRNNPIFIRLIGIIILGFVALALASCKTQAVITDIPTNQHVEQQHDSIYIHDSVRVYTKGDCVHDTTYIDRWHTRYKEIKVNNTDTIYKPYPVEVVREVKHVPKFYKVCAWALAGIVMLGVGKIVWKIVRK